MEPSSYITTYQQYLQAVCTQLPPAVLAKAEAILEQTAWDEPQSAVDLLNGAVVALVEADATADRTLRGMYLEMAIAALESGTDHPLCVAQLALVYQLLGDRERAIELAFAVLLNVAQAAYTSTAAIAPGLVFLPPSWHSQTQLQLLFETADGYTQSLLLAGEILWRSQLVFYNASGLRLLHLAAQLFPQSALILLRLGISSIVNGQWEGILYLHRSHQLAPTIPATLQALHLAYRDLHQPDPAATWMANAQTQARDRPTPDWYWATAPASQGLTYVPFEHTLKLAVEASFRSIVTSVLLAEGDWFEVEMEFWRDRIQPGMTVIDVGANVGVYTFSAALRVGPTGKVIAIEPFSGCVRCLEETKRVNQLSQVQIHRAAASDRPGTLHLALHGASELNQVITDPAAAPTGAIEEIPCLTLDSLIDQEHLDRVDFLKIDAEGHELQVLQGSDRLLRTFAPIILYENVAGSQGSNLPVAEYLTTHGYALFRYQPYLHQLLPISTTDDLQGNLNLIAMPQAVADQF